MQDRNGSAPTQHIGSTILVVTMEVDPEDEAEFNKWYNEQHLPERMEIPGYISARRFRLEEGDGALQYLCIWELEDGSPLESQMYQGAAGGPDGAVPTGQQDHQGAQTGVVSPDLSRDGGVRGPLGVPPATPGGVGLGRRWRNSGFRVHESNYFPGRIMISYGAADPRGNSGSRRRKSPIDNATARQRHCFSGRDGLKLR